MMLFASLNFSSWCEAECIHFDVGVKHNLRTLLYSYIQLQFDPVIYFVKLLFTSSFIYWTLDFEIMLEEKKEKENNLLLLT